TAPPSAPPLFPFVELSGLDGTCDTVKMAVVGTSHFGLKTYYWSLLSSIYVDGCDIYSTHHEVVFFSDPVRDYIQTNPGWYWASYAVFFVTYLTLSCCSAPRRQFPWNLILLTIFTLSLSYMTGMLSSYYNTKSVVMCLGIAAAVCLVVTIFSFQTKFDVTSCHGMLFMFCLVMFISGLVLAVVLPFQYVPWLDAIYASLGAILFTMFLAFDTQLLMGNKRYTMSPEEYVFATLSIYLDIVYIFSFFLQIFGAKRD
uniref:Protein lifeguard 2 n=1 Tax=Nothobranchius furzeri TaxID=105023 RepID=A0A8C6NYX6_NOTFU